MSEIPVSASDRKSDRPYLFQPGENGQTRRARRFVELHGHLVAELGNVSPIDAELIVQAVHLMVKAEKCGLPANDQVRCMNGAMRILNRLRAKYAKAADKPAEPVRTLSDVGVA